MKIMSNGPVDLCFSQANGPQVSQDTINTALQSLGQIGSSLTQRQRQFTDVEQHCGKRPSLPGKARNRWNDCAKEYAKSVGISPSTFTDTTSGGSTTTSSDVPPPPKPIPTWVWVVGGLVAVGAIGFVIYKSSKK